MTSNSRVMRTIEEQLKTMEFKNEEEEHKQRCNMYKTMNVNMDGFKTIDIDLPEGSILFGVHDGNPKVAQASEGMLWVDGEAFPSMRAAAFKASGNPTLTGWNLWKIAWRPNSGYVEVGTIRLTPKRPYTKRK